jgi:hypothetical protein
MWIEDLGVDSEYKNSKNENNFSENMLEFFLEYVDNFLGIFPKLRFLGISIVKHQFRKGKILRKNSE